jgi:hypothetical protein
VAQDLEPGQIAITEDGRYAWVTFTRNNAIGQIDLLEGQVTKVLGLGTKDHSLLDAEGTPINGFDASDRDGAIRIKDWPVHSFYEPDGIAVIGSGDSTYIVTANEGDPKDSDFFSEKERVANLKLDPERFPNAAQLKGAANLGRLQVTNQEGDTDGDGDYDQIFMQGSRSFSVWSATGELVFDSGDDLEQITALAAPQILMRRKTGTSSTSAATTAGRSPSIWS